MPRQIDPVSDRPVYQGRPPIRRLARNRFGRAYRETGKGAYDVEMRQLGLVPRTKLVEVGPVGIRIARCG